jgi:hypothetical protein
MQRALEPLVPCASQLARSPEPLVPSAAGHSPSSRAGSHQSDPSNTLPPPPACLSSTPALLAPPPPPDRLKDQLGDQIVGSEWEPIKILLQRENSAYTPNSQPRIATRVCQSHVVIKDVPTLGTKLQTIPKRKHDSRSKGLSCPAGYLADRPQPPGGPSARTRWTVRELRRMSEK